MSDFSRFRIKIRFVRNSIVSTSFPEQVDIRNNRLLLIISIPLSTVRIAAVVYVWAANAARSS